MPPSLDFFSSKKGQAGAPGQDLTDFGAMIDKEMRGGASGAATNALPTAGAQGPIQPQSQPQEAGKSILQYIQDFIRAINPPIPNNAGEPFFEWENDRQDRIWNEFQARKAKGAK